MPQDPADGAGCSALEPEQAAILDLVTQSLAAITVLLDGIVVYANQAAQDLVATPGGLLGRHVVDFVHPAATGKVRQLLRLANSFGATSVTGSFATQVQQPDGSAVHLESLVHAVRWAGRDAVGLISRDITARIRREADLVHAATHDPLTGLANRTLLLDRMELAMARIGRTCAGVLVMLLDLNKFKTVNDTYGHPAGDRVLQEFAARLRRALRTSDTVARLAGDEFVICADLTDPGLATAAIRARIHTTLNPPYLIDGASLTLTAGIGSKIITQRIDPQRVIADVDRLMYLQKHAHHRPPSS